MPLFSRFYPSFGYLRKFFPPRGLNTPYFAANTSCFTVTRVLEPHTGRLKTLILTHTIASGASWNISSVWSVTTWESSYHGKFDIVTKWYLFLRVRLRHSSLALSFCSSATATITTSGMESVAPPLSSSSSSAPLPSILSTHACTCVCHCASGSASSQMIHFFVGMGADVIKSSILEATEWHEKFYIYSTVEPQFVTISELLRPSLEQRPFPGGFKIAF